MTSTGRMPDPIAAALYDVESIDPRGTLVDRSSLGGDDIAQITRLMSSLSNLRDVEAEVSAASRRYMRLSVQDMKVIHYLIVARNRGAAVTPGMLTAHLGVSPSYTTKLLNRLEKGGHITRELHPDDRRAFIIKVTPETMGTAMQTVGRQQARRFQAAAALSPQEREIVTKFLDNMADGLSLADAPWASRE